ncbi:insulinase family protein [Carboxylicivirga sediminis]|uniref:Insulinase family protein n=1 Tax=Carboxylicivirga sediminis TaxID=2006564 RepID=A0A941IZW3_9BACT|nr:pitrilysin family protein [Carboxylicivirga sediminis]MBR8537748.1 insulinase family protein [Carboxylicivirga sediminis]
MSIDRRIAPKFKTTDTFELLPIETFQLDNGIQVHLMQAGSQEVAKLDFLFPAGSIQANKPLLSSITCKGLSEGTQHLTGAEISEKIDFYGAYIGQQAQFHHSIVTLVTLSHFLPQTLELLENIIKHPTFEQKEINTLLNKRKQEYLIESDKVKTLATRAFTQNLYGKEHPYGNYLTLDDFEQITREDVIDFHKKAYIPKGTHIIVSGQPGSQLKQLLNKHFGQEWHSTSPLPDLLPPTDIIPEKDRFVPKEGALQSAIKMGVPLFNKQHSDFHGMQILNTVLGGYFGSRLMTNIREEKGLTYGISSFIMTYKHAGFLIISSDVKAENRELALKEINNELQKLRDEPISEEELQLVKNFLIGDMIRNFDGPFATSDNYRGLIDLNLTPDYFNEFFNVLIHITSGELQQLAQKYFKEEALITVVAGK